MATHSHTCQSCPFFFPSSIPSNQGECHLLSPDKPNSWRKVSPITFCGEHPDLKRIAVQVGKREEERGG